MEIKNCSRNENVRARLALLMDAIAKHHASFTAIDPDHAIEQEHKKMKSKGGFLGITGNESAFKKYFIIAPTLSRVVDDFKDYAGIESRQATSLHHELTGGKGTRLIQNAAKLVEAISKEGNPFEVFRKRGTGEICDE